MRSAPAASGLLFDGDEALELRVDAVAEAPCPLEVLARGVDAPFLGVRLGGGVVRAGVVRLHLDDAPEHGQRLAHVGAAPALDQELPEPVPRGRIIGAL